MGKFTRHNAITDDGTLYGNIGIGLPDGTNPATQLHVGGTITATAVAAPITGAVTATTLTTSGAVTFNDAGAAVDFRVEGDTLPNLLLVDGSADIIYVTDAATGGTPPTAPTGGLGAGTLFVVQNNSAATDNSIVALIAGATSGVSQLDFGDADDANIGSISYDHATDTFLVTAGANAVAVVTSSTIIFNEDGDDIDFRVEGDTEANLLFCDGGVDAVGIGTGTPNTNVILDVVGGRAARQATLTLANGANTDITCPAAEVLVVSGPTGAFSLNGLTAGCNGRRLTIINLTGQNMTLTHEATSAAANQITTVTGADLVSTANCAFELVYDTGTNKWICVNSSL